MGRIKGLCLRTQEINFNQPVVTNVIFNQILAKKDFNVDSETRIPMVRDSFHRKLDGHFMLSLKVD